MERKGEKVGVGEGRSDEGREGERERGRERKEEGGRKEMIIMSSIIGKHLENVSIVH